MLTIRFFRVGKKNQPSFKIVVTDKRKSSTKGRFLEEVGNYNPLTKEKVLKGERVKYWLSVGAQPSDTVYNLLVSEKIVEGKKVDVHKKAKEKKGAPAEAPVAEKKEEKPSEQPAKEEKKEPVEARPQQDQEAAPAVKESVEDSPKQSKQEEKAEEKPKETAKEEKKEPLEGSPQEPKA